MLVVVLAPVQSPPQYFQLVLAKFVSVNRNSGLVFGRPHPTQLWGTSHCTVDGYQTQKLNTGPIVLVMKARHYAIVP